MYPSHHEGLEIWSPPLSQTITDLPVVIYAVGGVELAGFGGRGQAVIQSPLQTINFVFARFEVVPRPVGPYRERQPMILW